VSTFLPHEFVAHADSVGFPAPVCDVRLDAVAPDGTGELLIRGPNVVSATGTSRRPPPIRSSAAGCTASDAGPIDEEGLVYLVDRLKDMINAAARTLYCVEVENALAGARRVV